MACHLEINELCEAVKGQVLSEVKNDFTAIGTDTRTDLTGQLFVALRGDSFDAHNFLPKAVAQGAAVLLVDKKEQAEAVKDQVSVVLVGDTLKALQDLAHYWRKKIPAKVIALTGSNGKTTTKEFTRTIVSSVFKTHSNQGSYNNHWGVPLTILGASMDDQVLILEMGMNHMGEIRDLCKISDPEAVVVTNVGRAHIGNFEKGIKGIAQAKAEIYEFGMTHIFNLDNPYTEKMKPQSKVKNKMSFSSGPKKSDIHMEISTASLSGLEIKGRILNASDEVHVPVFGEHNLENLMAASALALAAGCTPEQIWSALPNCKNSWGRSQYLISKAGFPVVFDAYNSNPESLKALIDNIYDLEPKKKKYFFVGDMLEMGEESPKIHQELGFYLGSMQPDGIWFVGEQKQHFQAGVKRSKFDKNIVISSTYDIKLASEVQNVLKSEDVLIIKGSRGLKLEQLLEHLGQNFS